MNYQPAYNTPAEDIGYLIHCEGYTEQDAKAKVLSNWYYEEMHHRFLASLCKTKGHKLVDQSYGNAERGCMAASCTRCGWSFKTILY